MLFNSFEFLIFFPIVLILFFAIPHRFRWMLLLAASYYFYMCWKPEYIVLILISTVIDYIAGLQIGKATLPSRKKFYLVLSLFSNLGILFFFKYANFFSQSLRDSLQQFNIFYDSPVFDFLLPVGISFYTFQSLSYSIDVYRGSKTPETHLGKFALYVAFFPQLVAGPIERSERLLPQFSQKQSFDYDRFISGARLMLWGFFKKLVIADRLAIYVNAVYNEPAEFPALTLLMATYFFAFQIYCDFSGYSDIAIGASRIMGYDLMENFRQPYLAKSISEFWHRWHISLSSWFRDYLYIPLGGNRVGKMRWYLNLMIVFVVSGLWHGANWTFVVWGFLHGAFLVFAVLVAGLRERWFHFSGLSRMPKLLNFLKIVVTFHLVCLGWIFFRANSLGDALFIVQQISQLNFSPESIEALVVKDLGLAEMLVAIASIGFLLIAHFVLNSQKLSGQIVTFPRSARWAFYYALILGIAFFGVFSQSEFIYFQF